MFGTNRTRVRYLACTALTGVTMLSTPALAQEAEGYKGLQEIIVTAQKREQSVMDVPVAVSALSGDTLVANRVTDVTDLSSIAPGVTVRVSAGGTQLPSFSVRGAVSYGVVPGSDKQVSMYLDGVYISSPRGGIFDLPDVERIEMLRGPQGTLFGRNATAGAVSISTREPTGEAGVKGGLTVANQDGWRVRISADTPQIGPFSGYFSYVHNYRRGDIRNAKPGLIWDRTNSLKYPSIKKSAEWLGTKDSDSYFAALKFESGDFKTVYKYDRYEGGNRQTAEATGFVGVNRDRPLTGELVYQLVTSQPTPALQAADGKRPSVVDNGWVVPSEQTNQGHSLTSTLDLGDIQIKNIAAFRKSFIYATSPIDGFSSLIFTQAAVPAYATLGLVSAGVDPSALVDPVNLPGVTYQMATEAQLAPLVGLPFVGIGVQTSSRSQQWSDELQVNYDSDFLTVTAGGLWFKAKDWVNEHGLANNVQFLTVPGGMVGNALNQAINKATSIAAYAQAELHLSEQLDVILGGRITHDKKTSNFSFGNVAAPNVINDIYKSTRPNFLVGVNYKPNDDMLLYAKYSTAYVSGGATAGIGFGPEKAKSAEAGVKAELFDRRLRTSLAVYWAKYKGYQSAQGASTFGPLVGELLVGKVAPELITSLVANMGTFVLPQGDVESKGFEFDFSAAPTSGVTIGGSLSFNDTSFSNVPDILLGSIDIPVDQPGNYQGTYRPKWTGSVFAQYDSQPLFGDAYFSVRADANYQSRMPLDANSQRGIAAFDIMKSVPAYWIVNGRAALRDIQVGGLKGELALWGKNLFNEDEIAFGLINGGIEASANYIPARSYGLDFLVEF